jgi:predicted dehydrogenase
VFFVAILLPFVMAEGSMTHLSNRRTFLRQAGAGVASMLAAGVWTGRAAKASTSPNEKLNAAFIGTDGQANLHLETISALGHNCPCFCDVDENRMAPAAKLWPKAARYQDYRRMFDERQREIDAVFVATPDHHHYPASMIAIQLGKHVYCEKPLTHSIWEARQLRLAAQRNKVATQMGIQGHAGRKWRELITLARAGHIGQVHEVHAWSDRPIWPQGIARPKESPAVPANLDWDIWLGPAPERPYDPAYHPFNWRGWLDFGTGALGDMACHQLDGMFWLLDPDPPTKVEVMAASECNGETYPKQQVIRWEFPEKGDRPAFQLTWYDGGLFPPAPAGWPREQKLAELGCYFVGDRGTIVTGHGDETPMQVLDDKGPRDIRLPKELAIPPSRGHHEEFIAACKGGPPAGANFDYAGPMTEAILLGNLALRLGKSIHWDATNMAVPNAPEASQLIRRQYRNGWQV